LRVPIWTHDSFLCSGDATEAASLCNASALTNDGNPCANSSCRRIFIQFIAQYILKSLR